MIASLIGGRSFLTSSGAYTPAARLAAIPPAVRLEAVFRNWRRFRWAIAVAPLELMWVHDTNNDRRGRIERLVECSVFCVRNALSECVPNLVYVEKHWCSRFRSIAATIATWMRTPSFWPLKSPDSVSSRSALGSACGSSTEGRDG